MYNKLAKNSTYNVIYKGFNALFPLIISAYISRILLAEGVGKVTYANTIATYFSTLAALGLPSYGIKVIAQTRDDKKNRTIKFEELFCINFISTLLFSIAYYFVINSFDYFIGRRLLFNTMGLLVVLNFFNIDWFYQGIEEYKFIATRSIIMKIFSLILLLVLVNDQDDYILYALILCIGTAGNYVLNMLSLKKYIGHLYFHNLKIKKHIRPILLLLVSTIATEIYTMLDTVMIEYFFNETFVAYYTYSVKIVRMVYTVTIALVATFYPQISYFYMKKDTKSVNNLLSEGLKIILILSVACSVGLFLTAENIIPFLFGVSFVPAIESLKILSPLVVVFSLAYFLGHIVLMATGNERIIVYSTIVGAIVNFCLNIILIPMYQHCGASLASLVAEIIVTLINVVYAKRYFKVDINKNFIISIILANIMMILTVEICKKLIFSSFFSLFFQCVFGMGVYILVLYWLKNELLMRLLNIYLKKIRKE